MDDDDSPELRELIELMDWLHPEPAEVFENRLAAKLGIFPHPSMTKAEWRAVRLRAIEACGEAADIAAVEVEREMDG